MIYYSNLLTIKDNIMPEYKIIPILEKASLDDYVLLFKEAYLGNSKLDASYLDWLYKQNPHGVVIGFDAFFGNDLVGHYAISPQRYRFGSKSFIGALSLNTATHPNHQGKGLFIKLAKATYIKAKSSGIQFIVGVANSQSIYGFIKKLDFKNLGKVRLYLRWRSFMRLDDEMGVDLDELWLQWRLANPSKKYQLVNLDNNFLMLVTSIKKIPFILGSIKKTYLSKIRLNKTNLTRITEWSLIPKLTPYFKYRFSSYWLCMPLLMQPSPWEVIWLTLDETIDDSICQNLIIEGLSMDTF